MTRSAGPDDELIDRTREAIVAALARPLPADAMSETGMENTDADPRGYAIGYAPLRDLLDRTDLTDPSHVRAALYAVYGWMPKVLAAISDDGLIREVGRIALHARSLDPAPGGAVPAAQLEALCARIRDADAVRATNNEPTGLSKFLHLAAPTVVPIWDSRIRVALDLNVNYRAGFLRDFEAYVRALHDWRREGGKVPSDDDGNRLGTDEADPIGWVRAAEWYLFRVGPPTR